MLSNGLAGLKEVTGADVLFLCLHAGRGEGGILQAVLDVIAVPYTGSGALASALAMDKGLAKRRFRAEGVPVPAWFMAPVAPEDVTTALGWPVIVKPSKMGSSVGMTLVHNAEGLDAAVEVATAFDTEVMAEQFIPGRELTVGVLGDGPLPVGEIIPKHELFDYECKYTPGMSEELFPAKLDTALARQLQELALTAHRALKLGGYSRVDFRLSPEGDIFCLEANTLPGLTRTRLLPQPARAAGRGADGWRVVSALLPAVRAGGRGAVVCAHAIPARDPRRRRFRRRVRGSACVRLGMAGPAHQRVPPAYADSGEVARHVLCGRHARTRAAFHERWCGAPRPPGRVRHRLPLPEGR